MKKMNRLITSIGPGIILIIAGTAFIVTDFQMRGFDWYLLADCIDIFLGISMICITMKHRKENLEMQRRLDELMKGNV